MKKDTWDAATYSKFLALRTRPARDLLEVVPQDCNPAVAYDLGCGPGNSTALIRARWPQAKVVGIDSSVDMLAKASKEHSDIIFKEGNFGAFHPEEKVDLLFANASLHWIKDHYSLFPQLVSTLNKGGYFAVQMPNNAHAPTHQSIIKILQANPAWHKFMEGLFFTELAQPMFSTTRYYDLLTAAGLVDLTLWETEYVQEMADHQAIYNWVSGSALRPILDKLNESEQQEFEQAYLELISKAYPTQANGKVLLPFRRFFVVGKVN